MDIHSFAAHPPLTARLVGLIQDRSGQGMVEYVLMLMLIALAVIGFLPPVAGALAQLIARILTAFEF